VIVVCGPTAVGKTAIAIELARHYNTEIISADSRQCYKELNIGVARPSPEELQQVPHHFIASHTIQEEVTAAGFERYAMDITKKLFSEHDTIIMVGGTGLYIKAFCEGLDAIPSIDPILRKQIISNYEEKGMGWLQEELRNKDTVFATTGEMQNPQRMMRALEVVEATGLPISAYQKREKQERTFSVLKIGLELPREELIRNIDKRVTLMLESDLIKEVEGLIPFKDLNALQTVGYKEVFDHLEGRSTLSEAMEQIKIHTRQYAKRQMTWFRKDGTIEWFRPSQLLAIKKFTDQKLSEELL
jgi:tRNA dimethylallyltransferase